MQTCPNYFVDVVVLPSCDRLSGQVEAELKHAWAEATVEDPARPEHVQKMHFVRS